MATALVRGDAVRLHLPADAALRHGGAVKADGLVAGEGVPLLHRVLLRNGDRGSLPAGASGHEVAAGRLAGGGGDGPYVAVAAVAQEFPAGRVEAVAGPARGAGEVWRRAARDLALADPVRARVRVAGAGAAPAGGGRT